MESRHCGQDKRIFLCPVHNASTPCSLQAFGIRCMKILNMSRRGETARGWGCYLISEGRVISAGGTTFSHINT